ncbi:hypothetical protein C8R46DRAFT_1359391 [Mycena filopes]|nr:hypothetical protein C8R46DRAFT_1359391 [Mycena filopes]
MLLQVVLVLGSRSPAAFVRFSAVDVRTHAHMAPHAHTHRHSIPRTAAADKAPTLPSTTTPARHPTPAQQLIRAHRGARERSSSAQTFEVPFSPRNPSYQIIFYPGESYIKVPREILSLYPSITSLSNSDLLCLL